MKTIVNVHTVTPTSWGIILNSSESTIRLWDRGLQQNTSPFFILYFVFFFFFLYYVVVVSSHCEITSKAGCVIWMAVRPWESLPSQSSPPLLKAAQGNFVLTKGIFWFAFHIQKTSQRNNRGQAGGTGTAARIEFEECLALDWKIRLCV